LASGVEWFCVNVRNYFLLFDDFRLLVVLLADFFAVFLLVVLFLEDFFAAFLFFAISFMEITF